MKKFFAILLAMLLVMMSFAALADTVTDPETDPVTEPADPGEIPAPNEENIPEETTSTEPTIKKTYTTTGTADNVYPTETLTFSVDPANDAYPVVTVGANEDNTVFINGTTSEYTIPVNVPDASDYGEAGRYHYEVKETGAETASQAVDYDTDTTFNVDVYVSYKIVKNDDGTFTVTNELEKKVIIYSGADMKGEDASSEAKVDDFGNTYTVGELTVTKEISGNLADPDKTFTIEITLTSESNVANDIVIDASNATDVDGSEGKNWTTKTITLTAKGGDSVTISNIPTGVTYTIVETADTTHIDADAQMSNVNDPDAYCVTGEVTEENKGTIGNDGNEETITNTKEIRIPTGIALDTAPYMIILAIALFGLVKMASRKRREF